MRTVIRAATVAACLGLLATAPAIAGTLISVDDSTGNFYAINPAVPSATLLGNSVVDLSLTGLAYDSVNVEMWVSDTCDANCFGLGSVDLDTWEVTEIGGFVDTSNIHALAQDTTRDILFGWDIEKNQLVSLNRSTGEETYLGDADGPEIVGMAYDPFSDTLYGASRSDDNLYAIDPDTYAVTLVGALGHDADSQIGLDFDSDTGLMYMGEGDGNFYQVNPATGAATLLGNVGVLIDGLASLSGQPAVGTPRPVPAYGPLGLLLAVLLLGGFGWRRLRGQT